MHTIFKNTSDRPPKLWFGFPPWLLLGILTLFALGILALAIRAERREQAAILRNLIDRGASIIQALEAGSRSLPADQEQEDAPALADLAREFALQDGVIYIAITDSGGRVLAHSDPALIGTVSPLDVPVGEIGPAPAFRRRVVDGREAFEVYRHFNPFPEPRMVGHGMMGRGMMGMHRGMMMRAAWDGRCVCVGLDPVALAQTGDFYHNLLVWCLVAALGWAGFISLFWAHNNRASRKMLRDARAVATEVVTSLPLGLLTRAPDGRVAMANTSALDLLNLPRGAVVGRQLSTIPGLDWDRLLAGLTPERRSTESEADLVVPGRPAEPVHLGLSRISAEDGRLLGHLFVLHAIGEVKRLQAEVERGRRLTALGDLAAGVAHEIRNPLSSIKGLAVFLSRRVPAGGPEEEAARTMAGEVDRLNRVVSGLLDFARPEAIAKRPEDVNAVLSGAVRLARADIDAKGVSVQFSPDPALAPVAVNSERLTQALLNLILNAVQAMPPSGGVLRLSAARAGGSLVVTVADNGPGIPDGVRGSIFTPYFTTRPEGTGLGLAIVLQIVEGHGGRISVNSRPGAGTEFILTLPAEKG